MKRGRDRMSKWDGHTSGQNEPQLTEEEIRAARLRSTCKDLRSLARELERTATSLEEEGLDSHCSRLVLGFSTRLAQNAVDLAGLHGL